MTLSVRRAGIQGANGRWVLQEIDHTFAKGGVTLLLGRVGAGKSTLLELLGGVRQPDAGAVELDGVPVGSSASAQRRVSLVFQHPEDQLFARSVRGELAYSLRPYRLARASRECRVREALEGVGGEAAWLDRSPFALSGGQRRRVALAAALAAPADWWLFDEPTAGLDLTRAAEFAVLVRRLARASHGGAVVATHDLETCLPWADQVLLLREGRLAAVLSAADLIERPRWLADVGLAVPAPILLKQRLADIGVHVPCAWPKPAETAAAVAQAARTGRTADGAREAPAHSLLAAGDHAESGSDTNTPDLPDRSVFNRDLQDIDPRTAWILFAAFSTAALLQSAWSGIALTSGWIAVIAWRLRTRTLWRSLRPFLLLMLLAAALSGIVQTNAPPAWTWRLPAALQTLRHMAPVANALAVAALLAESVPPGRLQQGLQRLLARGEHIFGWRAAFTLAVTLTLRFVRLIGLEWERFSRIVRARGKRRAKPGRLPVRDAPALLVPLLLSLLRDADALAASLEDRGLRTAGQPRTNAGPMRLTPADRRALFLGTLAVATLVAQSLWR